MRRSSRFRFVLLAAVIGVIILVGSTGLAQTTPPPGSPPAAEAQPKNVNPFSIVLENWKDFVFFIILGCSIAGVTLIVQGFIKTRATVMIPDTSTDHIRELIGQKQFKELIEFTEADPSFVSKSINAALKRAPSFQAMKEAMETSIGEQTAESFRRIEYLNIIGNLGPLLGLLGTVIGMINSFENMRLSGGQADPKVLAGGISQALTHTMLGLLLALPCLASFGILRTMVDRLTVRGALIAEELLLMVRPAEAKPAAVAAARPAVPSPVPGPGVRKPVPVPAPAPAQG